jgi:Rrf2 family transcriptional regulator, cysteine metabolism repressor
MMDLTAYQKGDVPVFLSDIAKRQGISEKYLEQIFTALRTAGLVHSVRGRRGGFLLGKEPAKITAEDIVTVLEGPCKLVNCVAKPETCAKAHTCAARDVWSVLEHKIEEVLAGYSLDQLVRLQESKSGNDSPMYDI